MKPSSLLCRGALALCLVFLAQNLSAGTLTYTQQLSFKPPSSFSDNSIDAELLHNPDGIDGDLVRLFGDSDVTPTTHLVPHSPRVRVGGSFDANAGDVFSIVYDFSATLNSPTPITLTLGIRTKVDGVKETFTTNVTLNPGEGNYQGTFDAETFTLATSGLWKGRLFFNLGTTGSSARPLPSQSVTIDIDHIDFELAAVPEPSSLVLLGLGVAVLGVVLRRRQVA